MRPIWMVPCLIAILGGCREESPEAQIRKAFAACAKGIEAGDAGPALEVLHPQFRGPEDMGRDEARLFLAGLLRRERIGITVLSDRIEAQPDRGRQAVELLLTSHAGDAILPQDGSRKQFLLQWVRQDQHWKLRSIEEVQGGS